MTAPVRRPAGGPRDVSRIALHALGEADFWALAETAPIALFTSVEPYGVVLANQLLLEITGRTRGQIVGAGWMDAIHPEDRELVRAAGAVLETAGHAELEHRFVRPDGSIRWVMVTVTRTHTDPEHPVDLGAMVDITPYKHVEEALRDSEGRFRALVEHSFDIISVLDPDGTVRYTSPSGERITGFQAYEAGGSMLERMHPEDAATAFEKLAAAQAAAPGAHEPTDIRVHHADGHWLTLEAVAINLLDDPAIGGLVVFARDVTQQRATEAALRASEGRLRDQASVLEMIATSVPLSETLAELCRHVDMQIEGARCTVLLVSEDGATLRHGAAPAMPAAFIAAIDGVPVAETSGACGTAAVRGEAFSIADARTDPSCAAFRDLVDEHGILGVWSTPIRASSDGRVLGTFAVYAPEARLPTPDEEAMVENVLQLAAIAIERHEFEVQLERQAMHDPLTHLPNRALFAILLESALLRSRTSGDAVAVLFLDLDGFKVVNDSLGHGRGDEVLVALSTRLEEVLRHPSARSARSNDVLARFGGDEFTVLCESLDPEHAAAQAVLVAERLIAAVREPVTVAGEEQFLSASIGIALATRGDEESDALLRDADSAMYRAKARGRGRFELFDVEMRDRAQVRHETENALHRGVAAEEFLVHYQPIVDLDDGRCIGVEALLRWEHPDRGLLVPADFLDVAEDNGLIVAIGASVFEDATQQSVSWLGMPNVDRDFRCSVNLSSRQLMDPDLQQMVAGALERSGLPPAALCVEITETVLVEDVDAAVAAVRDLKELGVRVSIDDFGTGYSALGYLRQFPVDDVKIDRTFVERLGNAPEDSAIVRAIVSLGHALELTVTAEGVETLEQLAELRALRVDAAQGYLFAQPRPAGEIADLLGMRHL